MENPELHLDATTTRRRRRRSAAAIALKSNSFSNLNPRSNPNPNPNPRSNPNLKPNPCLGPSSNPGFPGMEEESLFSSHRSWLRMGIPLPRRDCGPTTPVSAWKTPLSGRGHSSASPVSSRKLAATLWELQEVPQSPPSIQVNESVIISGDLAQVLQRMSRLEQGYTSMTSAARDLCAELDRSSFQVRELLLEQKASRREVGKLLKHLTDKKSGQQEEDEVHERRRVLMTASAMGSIGEELKHQKKSKLKLEKIHKKVARELREVKEALARTSWDLEKERKEREAMEDVCKKLAQEASEDKGKIEELLKCRSANAREELEVEQKMLHMAEDGWAIVNRNQKFSLASCNQARRRKQPQCSSSSSSSGGGATEETAMSNRTGSRCALRSAKMKEARQVKGHLRVRNSWQSEDEESTLTDTSMASDAQVWDDTLANNKLLLSKNNQALPHAIQSLARLDDTTASYNDPIHSNSLLPFTRSRKSMNEKSSHRFPQRY